MLHNFRFYMHLCNVKPIVIKAGKLFCLNKNKKLNHFNIHKRWKSYSSSVYTLRKMKLETSVFNSCITEEVLHIKSLLATSGHEIRIVGGAVRDVLLGIKPEDLDFATTATPAEMKEIFIKNNIRLINANGERHGTITVRINEKNFEITTLRVDKTTDGRHAEVQFTTDWFLDANRRDLTVNAMYLDFNGTLYDYFNGYSDLMAHKVCFVGKASDRIKEDYLRILRYFRFYGKIADKPNLHDEDIINAIKENAKGLQNISGERIWVELNKIVSGNFFYELLLKIIHSNVGSYIGFPENCNEVELKTVCDRLKNNNLIAKPITVLVSLFRTEDEINNFYERIKPSSNERNLGYFIMENRLKFRNLKSIKEYQRLILKSKQPISIQNLCCELCKYNGEALILKKIENWKIPKFQIRGGKLIKLGVEGVKCGMVLDKLKDIWIDRDCNVENEKLLEHVPTILKNIELEERQKKDADN